MSGSREKDSSDFDLETFIDLFDTAVSSDNPAVKRALKNLLLIATLADSEQTPEQRVRGPLRRLVEDLRNINRRIDRLQEEQTQRQYVRTINTHAPNLTPPPYNAVGTETIPIWPNIGIGGEYTLTNSITVDNQYLPEQQAMNDLLEQTYQEILNRMEEK